MAADCAQGILGHALDLDPESPCVFEPTHIFEDFQRFCGSPPSGPHPAEKD
jgi:hypothetical protein